MNADQLDLRARNKSRAGLIWLSALAIGALGLTAWVQSESLAQRQWPEPQPVDWNVDGGIRQNAPVSPAKLPFRLFQGKETSSDPFHRQGAEAQWQLAEEIKPAQKKLSPPNSQPQAAGHEVGDPWPNPIDTAIDYGNRAVDVSRQVTDVARQTVNQVVSDTAGKAAETVSQSTDKVGQLANQVAETVQEPLPKISMPNMQDGRLRLPKVIGPGVKQAIQQRLPERTAELPKLKDMLPSRLQAQLPPINPPKVQDVVDVAKKVVPKVVPPKLKVPDLTGGALRLPQVTIPKPKRPEESRYGIASRLNTDETPQGQVNLPDVSLPDLPQPPPVKTPQWSLPNVPAPEVKAAPLSGLPALPPAQTPQRNVPNVPAPEVNPAPSSGLPALPPAQTPPWNIPDMPAPEANPAPSSGLPALPPVQTPPWNIPDMPAPEVNPALSSGLPARPPEQTPPWNVPNVPAPEVNPAPSSGLSALPPAQTPWNVPDMPAPQVDPAPPSGLPAVPPVQTQQPAMKVKAETFSQHPASSPIARPAVTVPQATVAQIATPRIHIPTPPQIRTPKSPDALASTSSALQPPQSSPQQSQAARPTLESLPSRVGAHTAHSSLDLSNVKLPPLGLPKVQAPVGQVPQVQSPGLPMSKQNSVRVKTPNVPLPHVLASESPVVQPHVPAVGKQELVAGELPQFADFAFPKSPAAEVSNSISGITRPTIAPPTPPKRQTNPPQFPNFSAPQLLNEKPPQTESVLASSAQVRATRVPSSLPTARAMPDQPTTPPLADRVVPRAPLAASANNVGTTTVASPVKSTDRSQAAEQSRASAWGSVDTSASNSDFVVPNASMETAAQASPGPTFSSLVNVPQATEPASTVAAPFSAATPPVSRQTMSQNGDSGPGELFESSRVLAIVGDQPILSGDVIGQVNQMLKQYEGQVPAEELDQQRQLLVKQALPSLIDNKLIFSDFMRTVPPDKLPELERRVFDLFAKEELPKLIEKAEVKTARELDAKLREVGSSIVKQRRLFMEKAIAQQMVRQNVRVAGDVKHDELLQYYEEHLDEYKIEARARFEHLMARFDKFTTREEALNAIAAMGNQVLGGAPSNEVAKRSSHGPLASQGGVYDWTTQGSLASEVMDKALFSLPIGRWSKIVEDSDGFHIIRVIAREPAGEISFADVQSKIAETIQRERFQTGVQDYLAKLRASTHVSTSSDEEDATATASPPANGRTRLR